MNIPIKLDKDFTNAMQSLFVKYGENFEYLNGFHESQLNFSDFINGFIDKNVADITIDANANASHKDIVSLNKEKSKSHDKLFAFNKIFYELKKKYGLSTARKWLEDEYSGAFYLHDASTSSYLSYCYAYDLTRLATEGLFFLSNYNNRAPNHLTTFVDDVIEYISFMCNRSSGAVGIPNILIWTFYFWKKDCESGHYIKNPDYYIRQSFQKFIYRLNQPFLRLDQSAFTNVSIFDRNYIEALFGSVEYPDGTFVIDYVEELIEHQKIFMEVVSDVRSENMFTFPVLTYSLLYRDGKFVDEDFARWCSDHNTKWNDSNFFISGDVNTLSNCCFDGSQTVVVREVGAVITHRVTFERLYEEYGYGAKFEITQGDGFAEGKLIMLPGRPMYYIETLDNKILRCTDNHIHPTRDGDKYTSDLKVGDYLKTNSGFDIIVSIKKLDEIPKHVYCFEMDDQSNPYFTLSNGIVTHNCRLLSDTSKLNAFINSIGGTALSIGSVKVNTINLMRIAYETKDDTFSRKNAYLRKLRERVELCCKTLNIIRSIISRNIEKGLLPNYIDGGVELEKQYCTIGILGLYEVIREFGLTRTDEFGNIYYTDEGIDFASRIFEVLNDVKDNFPCNYSFNIESVPAERAAVVLCQKDNEFFELRDNDEFIYSNQWIPLSAKCTLQEKLRVCSILDEKCSGGSIAHINLESNFPNTDVAWDILNKIAQSGVIYFAFNTRINECENHHGFVGTSICLVCGKPVHDTYQRIVGYLVPTRAYSRDRFKEFNARRWFEYVQDLKVMME